MIPLTIERSANTTIIHFCNDLDAATVPECRALIDAHVTDADSRFVVDISSVSFIDSHGVGLFVCLLKKAHTRNGKLSIQGAQEQPLSVLKMVGFNNDLVEYIETCGKASNG